MTWNKASWQGKIVKEKVNAFEREAEVESH
jgi:hypothetical protein